MPLRGSSQPANLQQHQDKSRGGYDFDQNLEGKDFRCQMREQEAIPYEKRREQNQIQPGCHEPPQEVLESLHQVSFLSTACCFGVRKLAELACALFCGSLLPRRRSLLPLPAARKSRSRLVGARESQTRFSRPLGTVSKNPTTCADGLSSPSLKFIGIAICM